MSVFCRLSAIMYEYNINNIMLVQVSNWQTTIHHDLYDTYILYNICWLDIPTYCLRISCYYVNLINSHRFKG